MAQQDGSVPQVGVEGAPSPSTPTRRPMDPGSGSSPPAKRLELLQPVTGPDGPVMDHGGLSRAIYELDRKFQSIENWAKKVNEAVGEHANQIDTCAQRTRNQATHASNIAVKIPQLEAKIGQVASDLAEAARQTIENDGKVKGIIDANDGKVKGIVEQMNLDIGKLKELESAARGDLSADLGRKINEVDGALQQMKAAVASASGSTPEAYAVRLSGIESSVGALDQRVTAVNAETMRLAAVEPMLGDLTSAFSRLESVVSTAQAAQAASQEKLL